jgi:hypothetical protein
MIVILAIIAAVSSLSRHSRLTAAFVAFMMREIMHEINKKDGGKK